MEEEIIKPPYWWVEYVDDIGFKHIATIKDKNYLEYLKDRYNVTIVKIIET